MRLIDADALMRRLCVQCDVESHEATCDPDECFVYNVIVYDAPTIDADPVRHATWVKDGNFLICLNCESEIDVKNSLGVENRKNYCPNCGVKMDGGVSNCD